MRVVLQRVTRAEVRVAGGVTGKIGAGFLVLAGFSPADTETTLDWMAEKILGLLQRDGRLVDFLMEDITAYPDAQVGAAVRDVHANCRASLSRYVTLAPVVDTEEGGRMTVQVGADPARIKVVGAVAAPPVSGVVRHRGWEAARLDLPPLPSTGRTLIAPAEVELA